MNQVVELSRSDFYQELSDYLVRNKRMKESDLLKVNQLREQINAGLLPALLMKEQAGGDGLPALLIKLGVCSERSVAEAIAHVNDKRLTHVSEYPNTPPLEDKVSARFFKEYRVVVLQENMDEIVVAIVDPSEIFALDALQLSCKKKILVQIGVLSEVDAAIEKQFGSGKSLMGQIVDDMDADDVSEDDIEQLKDLASEAPVIRIVNLIMQRALEYRASDIHIEPFEQQLKVRLRVDGVLQDMEAPPVTSTAAVISRIKIMAKLNIAERRLPQDGRIKTQIQGKELDLRVSTIPTMHGESIVIRILDKENIILDFNSLGFSEQNLERFQKILALPHGIILITGPTGSGKTTTLYTALNQLNTEERKIITVEDPVEYQLSGINQVQALPKIGLDFAKALRSIVRQDPDVIMIGEMRDLETATIAVQSALTGHQVLSTLHTNDAVGGITRLLDMGLEDYLLTSTINGILAQRLVRRLCEHCRRSYMATPELIEELGLRKLVPEGPIKLYEHIGCDECSNIGFYGRIVILELMQMSDQMRKLIMNHENSTKLMTAALEDGMQTMFVDGLSKALEGQTTVEEILRVTSDA